MKKIYSLFLLFIFLHSISIYSQKKDVQTGDPNDLDQKFVPDKSSILNSVNSTSTSSGHREGSVKNIIKFNLALLGRGTAAVFWEHPFGKVVSVEGGLGLCFDKDYMQGVFAGAFADAFDNGNNTSKYVPLSTLLNGATFAGGPNAYLSGAVKLYFTDDAPEGSYFSFNMRYYTNNLQVNPTNSPLLQGSSDITVKNLGFNALFGYQFIGGGKNVSLVNDFYFGFGLRRTAYDGIQVFSGVSPLTGGSQTTWTPDGTTQTNLAPVFLIGYSLGFGF